MKVLNLVQGTQEWIDARYNYITATDVASVLNVNPYETALDLYELKTQRVQKQFDEATKRRFEMGHQFESEMRVYYQDVLAERIDNPCVTHEQWFHLFASLDGITRDRSKIYEFKWSNTSVNEVPIYHMTQVQTQLALTGAEECWYVRGKSKDDYQKFIVKPDQELQTKIMHETLKFFTGLQEGIPPEPTERDYFTTNDPLFELLREKKLIIDDFQAQYDEIKNQIIDKYKEQKRVRGHNVLFMRTMRKGSIPYSKLEEVRALDLEKYRSKPSEVITIKVGK